ncbi:RsfA family transcriptional regulator [Priestia taiwanensis]|uniref:Transcriptional regulator n=1 Tax=Priestia taiwanensis TaxID=1347902 RepID=A0A917ETY3_9BACI|nr:RsfA family transcriptional regulator [Priestia taiwanensis]MBM7364939.1 prespore-specific regulator [Priestia taiwanensis]GGE82358.1 transcriptional regulator [Priestia taiwanensis]
MKTRQDAWTEENDLLLAETVLKHVREGSTQLNAFEEVGDILNRTSAACGFRWNAVVRHQYEQSLKLARKYWKGKQRTSNGDEAKKKPLYQPSMPLVEFHEEEMETPITPTVISHATPMVHATAPTTLTMHDIIVFLQSMAHEHVTIQALQQENIRLKQENELIKGKACELEGKIGKLEADSTFIQEDYETLMKIMNRARKMVLFDEEDRNIVASSFRMDKNGNLERIAE